MAPKKAAAAVEETSVSPALKDNVYGRAHKEQQEFEFGGPIGVTALMIWSHYILFYFW
jgi:hypothetical protein